jgi:pyruvate kinase
VKVLCSPFREQCVAHLTHHSPDRNVDDARSQQNAYHKTSAFGFRAKKPAPVNESDTQVVVHSQLRELIQHLNLLRSEMLELETSGLTGCGEVHPEHAASARNLMHYLALRRHDIRHLQSQLAALGLSSLGRTESHVMSALHTVVNLLGRLSACEEANAQPPNDTTPALGEGALLLEKNTEALLGTPPAERNVRIMVTMPREAATDYELVRDLLSHGMDCMRINCAHDGPEAWSAMIANLRRAEKETNKRCKVAMDLAGPKLRTGPVQPGPAALKYRPKRDALGRVLSPARIWLTPSSDPEIPPASADAVLPVPRAWLRRLKRKDCIRFTDARGASRTMTISGVVGHSRWADAVRTAYIVPGLALEIRRPIRHGASGRVWRTQVGEIPRREQTLRLKLGDTLVLTKSLEPGRPAQYDNKGKLIRPAQIGVSLPEFFDSVRPGEPIWLDDGKIGGVIRSVAPETVDIEITQARPPGEKLGSEKGINAPESVLRLSPLTKDDLEVLKFVVQSADIVGYSFVRSEADVLELQARLAELGASAALGIILKIETRESFEQLPRLLLAAMRGRAVGVMIARGDLAVECGYQRLAEVQEEILWISEAAHLPVIWATQVLESLAKNGIPSRSEITDAAMGERAECVMLNKGPYIVTAVQILDDILRRMQAHQEKKRSMLRKLHLADAFRVKRMIA